LNDDVIIADAAYDPIVDQTRAVNSLTIETGAVLDLNGNEFTINGIFTNNGTLKMNNSETPHFTNDTAHGTVEYYGSGPQSSLVLGSDYYNLKLSRAGACSISGVVTVANTLTLAVGSGNNVTLDNASNNFSTVAITSSNNVTLVDANDITLGDSTPSGALTVTATNINIGGDVTIASGKAFTVNGNLNVNTSNKTLNASAGSIDLNGNLALSNGTLVAPAGNFNISGNWANNGGAFNSNSGTVIFDGTTTISGSNATTFNNITISNPYTLNGHATNMNVTGNWTNSGTFNAGTGTVTFTGDGTSIISGNTTFKNLKCVTPGKTLSFPAGSTQTVGGTLEITGTSGSRIILSRSGGSPGDHWNINVTTPSPAVSYVTVSDSDATTGSLITASGSNRQGRWSNFWQTPFPQRTTPMDYF